MSETTTQVTLRKGASLRERLLRDGSPTLCWLGQHGFALGWAGQVVVIDAYLKDEPRRQFPPITDLEGVAIADVLIGTHDHADHIDHTFWPELARQTDRPTMVMPRACLKTLSEKWQVEAESFVTLEPGESVEVGPLKLTAIPAAHEFLETEKHDGLHPYMGVMIQGPGGCIYHAGDTVIYEGIHKWVRQFSPEVMLLPINGRDAERYTKNIIGNMTYQEAVDLAGHLGAKLAVPTHWDMFAGNPGDPDAFASYMKVKFPEVETWIPEHGKCIDLSPWLATRSEGECQ